MSESDATFDLIGKQHAALAELISKNAWRMAGAMVTGMVTRIDGELIREELRILSELRDKVNKEIHS